MRVRGTEGDSALRQIEHGLRRFAEAEGYLFGAIFHEHETGSFAEFARLVAELRRTGARHVVVPSCDHFSAHRLLRDTLLDTLQRQAGAQVWVLPDVSGRQVRSLGPRDIE
ncbi:MAG: hypothetical protein M3Y33_02230 [Actinomycetota bacterium]|nr:hypothetical protein [Actinomycetota bacterium]